MHDVWILAHCRPRWYDVDGRLAKMPQLSVHTLEYLGNVLGNVVAGHYSASSSRFNIQTPIPKVGSILVRINQNGIHPHECHQKIIIIDLLWKDYK